MTIEIEVDGTVYKDFTSVSVAVSMEQISGEFNFLAVTPTSSIVNGQFPFKLGQSCVVLIDGFTKISGFIDAISPTYDNSQHVVSVMGRDKTSDIIDATLGGKLTFDKDISLENLTLQVLKTAGITGLNIINEAGVIDDFKEGEIETGDFGDSLLDFLDIACRKKQVLLTTDGLGNIVFARSQNITLDIFIRNQVDTFGSSSTGNILSASGAFNDSERFNKYVAQSQENASGVGFSFNKAGVVGTKGESFDNGIRTSRVYNFFTESSSSADQCLKRAQWEGNIRQVKAFNYSVVLQGHTPFPGIELRTNRVINVRDDFMDILQRLLIKAITWNFSVEGGSTTTLHMAPEDAYQVEIAEPIESTTAPTGLAGIF